MTRYTASVVGGGSGGKLSLTGLAASPRFQVAAAADLRPEVCEELKKSYPGLRTFASHQEMFRACPTDVVCVSTFPPSHKQVTLDALELPLKGILVEKPLGDTAAAGRDILKTVRARKLPMAVPHGLLVASHSQEILKRVRRGDIGRLLLVEIENDKWDIINAGIHWLNFFVMLTGGEPIDYVMALCDGSTRTYRDGMQVETAAVTYVQTRSGVRCVLNSGDEIKIVPAGKGTLFRLIGTAGMLEFWGWESAYRLLNAEQPAGQLFEIPRAARTFHQCHLDNLAEQMDRGQADYTVAESSLAALEICEAAYLSSAHRCKVSFPFESFTPPSPNDWRPGQPYSGSGGGRDGRKLG